jgi:hypothetical protein
MENGQCCYQVTMQLNSTSLHNRPLTIWVAAKDTEWSQYKVTWDMAPPADGVVLPTLGEVTPYSWNDYDEISPLTQTRFPSIFMVQDSTTTKWLTG